METWEWVQNVKIFVSHVNVQLKSSMTEEAPNNQVDKMTQQLAFVISHSRTGMVGIFMKWPGDQHTFGL